MIANRLFKTLLLALVASPIFAQTESALNGTDIIGTWELATSTVNCPKMDTATRRPARPTVMKFYPNGQMECSNPTDMFFGGMVKWSIEQHGTWLSMGKNESEGTGFGPETNNSGDMVFNLSQFTDSCGYVPAKHVYRRLGGLDYVRPVAKAEIFVPDPNDPIFGQSEVDTMATFGRGESSIGRYNALNIKYPAAAREGKVQGLALIDFIVEKDGSLSNFRVKKDPGGGCADEALRILQAMPKWRVAMKGGVPVRVRVDYPVVFKLE